MQLAPNCLLLPLSCRLEVAMNREIMTQSDEKGAMQFYSFTSSVTVLAALYPFDTKK